MAELASLKTKRAIARTSVTKKIKAADKCAADDIAVLRVKELQTGLQSVQGELKEQEAHEHYMEQFTREGKTEEEIVAEAEANSVVEQNYDEAVDRLSDLITMNSIFLSYEKTYTGADAWLTDGSPAATDFLVNGKTHRDDMEKLISDLTPMSLTPSSN